MDGIVDNDIESLRKSIQGLKMSGLGHVDQEALTTIREMINILPSAEELLEIASNQTARKKIAEHIGRILELIEIYGKRGSEKESREISIRNLPPRYQVLKWRPQMQNISANDKVRNLVKLSSRLESAGKSDMSVRSLVIAKKIHENKINQEEFESFVKELSSSDYNNIVTAGIMDGLKGAWQGVKNIGHMIADPYKTSKAFGDADQALNDTVNSLSNLEKSLKSALSFVYNESMKGKINQILSSVQELKTTSISIKTAITGINRDLKQTTDSNTNNTNTPATNPANAPATNPEEAPETTTEFDPSSDDYDLSQVTDTEEAMKLMRQLQTHITQLRRKQLPKKNPPTTPPSSSVYNRPTA